MKCVEITKKYCLLVGIIIPLFSGMRAQTAELRTVAPKPFVTSKEPHQEDYLPEMLKAQPGQSPVRYDSAGLDSFIRITMDTAHVPGVATWCSKNGQIIWQQCYGYANLEDSIAVADTTSFILASISKTVVGTAIMQLWERNIFQLDDDINGHLPFNVRNPHHPDSAITFRMLMTHTSSINDVYAILDPLIHAGDPNIPLGEFLSEYLL